MDETTRLRMRRGHLKHRGYCTCGTVVAGNGGKASHRAMHQRKGDGHFYLIEREWQRRKALADARGMTDAEVSRLGLPE